MFVDNECARLLKEPPLADELAYSGRVFSLDHQDELLTWLSDIEQEAPQGHVELVERVYGSSWLAPRHATA